MNVLGVLDQIARGPLEAMARWQKEADRVNRHVEAMARWQEEADRVNRQFEEMARWRKEADRVNRHLEEMETARRHVEAMARWQEEADRVNRQFEEMETARRQFEEMETARRQFEEMARWQEAERASRPSEETLEDQPTPTSILGPVREPFGLLRLFAKIAYRGKMLEHFTAFLQDIEHEVRNAESKNWARWYYLRGWLYLSTTFVVIPCLKAWDRVRKMPPIAGD
jgi:chromosome segregation ATPase